MKKIIVFLLVLTIICIATNFSVMAFDDVTISIDTVSTPTAGVIDVPIRISGNAGICGANIVIDYDSQLELIDITEGGGLSTLTMTKPGDMTSNPFVLVWDGMEQDASNGIIAVLSLKVPSHPGTYRISLSCENGDVVDGGLNPITPVLQAGAVIVDNGVSDSKNIRVDTVNAKPDSVIEVPITLSGNTGICGANLEISYDSKLVLTDVVKGTGLSTLTMTKPGDMTSNPFALVWDGMEQDTSNGVIATLIFKTPIETGTYFINVNYNDGDIVDGQLHPISLSLNNGSITVKKDEVASIPPITSTTIKKLTSSYKFNISSEIELYDENIIVAVFSEQGKLLHSKTTMFDGDSEGYVTIPKNPDIRYAKVFVWTNWLQPIGGVEIINSGF